MKLIKSVLLFTASWFLISAMVNGCTCVMHNYYYTKPRPVYASSAPPEAKTEQAPPSPGAGNVWIPGHWYFDGVDEKWSWQKGFWELPPEVGADWVAPFYDDNDGDTVFWPGYWNPPNAKDPEPIDQEIPSRPVKLAEEADAGTNAETSDAGAKETEDGGARGATDPS